MACVAWLIWLARSNRIYYHTFSGQQNILQQASLISQVTSVSGSHPYTLPYSPPLQILTHIDVPWQHWGRPDPSNPTTHPPMVGWLRLPIGTLKINFDALATKDEEAALCYNKSQG